jgi:vitamin B12 transporter
MTSRGSGAGDPFRTIPMNSVVCRRRAAFAAALSFVLVHNVPAHAGEPEQSVVVSAARVPQSLADALPHTTVLTRTDIEHSQALDLVSLLPAEAGVQFSASGARGSATSLFLRGAPARQVLVLVDGVALARQDATGQVGIEHLMLEQVDRIEIVRGNVSALYGAGAVGGVIQVFTRQGGEPLA